jgi:hypothetical protein
MVGAWGLYPWFEEDGVEQIEPRYREAFRNLQPYGKVFFCVGERDGYIELQYHHQRFWVKPALFQIVQSPAYTFGDVVRMRKNPQVTGSICGIGWHYKRGREMYVVEVNGKKQSSRYFREDFIEVERA